MSNYLNNKSDILFRVVCYTFVTCVIRLSLGYPQILVDIMCYFCAYLTLLGGLTKFESVIVPSSMLDATLIATNGVLILWSVFNRVSQLALAYALISECVVYAGHTNDGLLLRCAALGSIIRPDYAWALSSVLMFRDGVIVPSFDSGHREKAVLRLRV